MSQFRRIMATAVLLVPILATDARGQRLLEIEGIELYGEVQLVQAGGGICNVLESDTGYDRRKQNDGAPMDIWRIDFTVRNRSGRWLDHLIANFEVESEWPECTNWDIPDSATLTSHFSTLVEWAGTSGFIQETGFNVVAPHESLIETRLLVVLRGDPDPWFSRWSVVDYRFAANPPRITGVPPPEDVEAANRPPWEGPNAAALPIPRKVEAPKPDPPSDEPSVTDMYLQADADCLQGRYEPALAGFERVAELGGALADLARYRMGECRLAQDRLDDALEQFETLIRDFPDSNKIGEALYKKGLILVRMGHESDARQIFEDILVVFPGTSEARLAKRELDAIPASDPVEAIKPDIGFCDIPLDEATIVVIDRGPHYEAYGPSTGHIEPGDYNTNAAVRHFEMYGALFPFVAEKFPSFFEKYLRYDPRFGSEMFLPETDDADCVFDVADTGNTVYIFDIGQKLQSGQTDAQTAFATAWMDYLHLMPWSPQR